MTRPAAGLPFEPEAAEPLGGGETAGESGPGAGVDSVARAAASPNQSQPYRELGLSDSEYRRIREILNRRPSSSELAMYSVMWSEHCSYKSSKKYLREFGRHASPESQRRLLAGIGDNAGVLDIGEGWAVTFKVESHNHPSFVEPRQGAATGVGGIVRDIVAMGARPVAVMDALRFGAIDHPDTARVVHGVVSGISFYGNCLGLPNIGGETRFDACYQSNPLVNALAVGVLRSHQVHRARASGVGNLVVLFGARTGADGIGGASILASDSFGDGGPTKRPAVQVGDPFLEKLLVECCLELFAAGLVTGIQDLGAAGISCATAELAAGGSSGMTIDLERVPLRDPGLSPEEILMSESQERMMAIVEPGHVTDFLRVTAKWDLESSVLGEVTDNGRLQIRWHGTLLVDVDPHTVATSSPEYDRPVAKPGWQDSLSADSAARLPRPGDGAGTAILGQLLQLLASPNHADTSWITEQYDRYVLGNTAFAMPEEAGMIRVSEESGLGVAVSVDANSRFSCLDPREGARLALAEAFRNVACSGAEPIGVSDCLNFGSPENPEVMWQFAETIDGLASGCAELGIPVTGGNVSFYNQTGDTPIHPTPLVAVLGVIDDVARRVPSGWQDDGRNLYLLGETRADLDGSSWADAIHGHLGGVPPRVDLAAEVRLAGLLHAATVAGLIDSAHDLSDGGLAVALVEACLRFGVGARILIEELRTQAGVDTTTLLFSETPSRVLVSVPRDEDVKFRGLCAGRGYPVVRVGVTDAASGTLEVQHVFTVALADLAEARQSLARVFA